MFANDGPFIEGPWVKFVPSAISDRFSTFHYYNGWLVVTLAAVHVAAIVFYLTLRRNDLITPMLTGDKLGLNAIAAEDGGKIADGVANYDSSTGREPAFHEYDVADVLSKEAVYFVDFNVDGWAVGDWWNPPLPSTYTRGNTMGTDLNRQMPSIGRIQRDRLGDIAARPAGPLPRRTRSRTVST
jgi:hypothetical protein